MPYHPAKCCLLVGALCAGDATAFMPVVATKAESHDCFDGGCNAAGCGTGYGGYGCGTGYGGYGCGTGCGFGSAGIGFGGNGLCFLERAPAMKGGFLTGAGPQMSFRPVFGSPIEPMPLIDTPVGGRAARVKIADNNKALPQDRMYFVFNYFNNAIHVQPGGQIDASPRHMLVRQYTVGFEKTMGCGEHSVEVRFPFTSSYDYAVQNLGVSAENAGNLAVIYKKLLATGGMDDTGAAVAGLGVNIPTGTDVDGQFLGNTYQLRNDAVHLLPYLGFMGAEDSIFVHLFVQLDFVANGNPVSAQESSAAPMSLGKLNDQHLFHLDVSFGRWLFEDHCSPLMDILGVAAFVELHYATTLNDTDNVSRAVGTDFLRFSNYSNRVDILDVTTGLHLELGSRLNLSISGVLPLRQELDRGFDAGVLTHLNYLF